MSDVLDQNLKDISDSMGQVYRALRRLYPGETQGYAALAITASLFSGKRTVLLIGEHGTGKTSMVKRVANWLRVPTVSRTFFLNNRREVEAEMTAIADLIKPKMPSGEAYDDPAGAVMSNLVYGVRNMYTDLGDKIKVRMEIDTHIHKAAARLKNDGWAFAEKPARFYFRQITKTDRAEGILAPAYIYKPQLGEAPPHVDVNSAAHAHVVFFDEGLANPMFMADAHKFLFDMAVDTPLGEMYTKPVLVAVAANPSTEDYATNPDLMNLATMDRFATSAFLSSATMTELREGERAQIEALELEARYRAENKLDRLPGIPISLVDLSAQYIAKMAKETNTPFEDFILQLMDSCFFDPDKGEAVRLDPVSPFVNPHDCSVCRFGADAVCAVANVSPARIRQDLPYILNAVALIYGRTEPKQEDTARAMLITLPARMKVPENYRTRPYDAIKVVLARTKTLMNRTTKANVFVEVASLPRLDQLTPDSARNAISEAIKLRSKYKDDPLGLVVINNYLGMVLREVNRKKEVVRGILNEHVLAEEFEAIEGVFESLTKPNKQEDSQAEKKGGMSSGRTP